MTRDDLDDELRATLHRRADDIGNHPERFSPSDVVMKNVRDALEATKRLRDLRGNAEGLLYTSRMSLEEYGHVLDDDDFDDIAAASDALQAVASSEDADAIERHIRLLESLAHRMAEHMCAEAVGDDDDGEGGDGGAAPAAPSPLRRR